MTTEPTPRKDNPRRGIIRGRVKKMTPEQRRNIALLAMPRIVRPYIPHIPHPTQQVFLSLGKYREVMFGGAAGGGKSDALLMAALQYVDVPGYSALILRRTWPDLVLPGAIMDRANQWLSGTPARKREGGRMWEFPSGARLQFGYLQHDNDKYRYASAEFQYIGWDELTQFPDESTYEFLFSRLRKPSLKCMRCMQVLGRYRQGGEKAAYNSYRYSHNARKIKCTKATPDPVTLNKFKPAGDGVTLFEVPLRVRSASNPGGRGMAWVKERLVDEQTRRKGTIFVPSKLVDNPSLDEEGYRESLSYLDEVERMRLEEGDWEVVEAGDMFDRSDFRFIREDQFPHESEIVEWVRFWDLAATENQSSDWTVGTLMGLMKDGRVLIADLVRFRGRPSEVERKLMATAKADGPNVAIRYEEEGGSSGKIVTEHMRTTVFPGFDFDGIRSDMNKAARARAYASYVAALKVIVVTKPWVRDFLSEHESFPDKGSHDDQVDASAGAFNELMMGTRARLIA